MFGWHRGAVMLTAGFVMDLLAAVRGGRNVEITALPCHLERNRDPYFSAFLARCMDYVYGRDPRHHSEAREER